MRVFVADTRAWYPRLFIACDIVLNDERAAPHAAAAAAAARRSVCAPRDNGVLLILTSNGNVTSQLKLFTFLRRYGGETVGRLFSVLT